MSINVDSLVWIPLALLGRDADALRKRLTVTPRGYVGEEPEPIACWFDDSTGTKIGVPLDFGLKLILHRGWGSLVEYSDVSGYAISVRRFPDPNHPNAAPGQAEFMENVLTELRLTSYALAQAPTGTGKTVVCLNTAGKLGVTTLVIVPSKAVAEQWAKETRTHLGLEDDEIGRIEEGCYRYAGCAITIAVIHNLVQKSFPPEFYEYFGFVVWDECQTLGARSFSQTMYMFPAYFKLAVSATPKRNDGCGEIFLNYFGEPSVVSEAEALPADCFILTYEKDGGAYPAAMPKARQINCLTRDMKRNRFLVSEALLPFWQRKRVALCVSDRVEHLQVLMSLCFEAGVPESAMGLFVRAWVTPDGKKRTFKQAYLEALKTNTELHFYFATYGMFKFAIDIPRLDAGLDATPRAEGTQLIGRIRRPLPGKRKPVWLTVRDKGNVLLTRMLAARVREFRANNVIVQEYGAQTNRTVPATT